MNQPPPNVGDRFIATLPELGVQLHRKLMVLLGILFSKIP
jgi:hypothetical protein